MTAFNEIVEFDQWYMTTNDGGYSLDKGLLDSILMHEDDSIREEDDSIREKELHCTNRPMLVGNMNGFLVKQWLFRGKLHRYYGAANNATLNAKLEFVYDDNWYIHGKEIKGGR